MQAHVWTVMATRSETRDTVQTVRPLGPLRPHAAVQSEIYSVLINNNLERIPAIYYHHQHLQEEHSVQKYLRHYLNQCKPKTHSRHLTIQI